MSGVSAMRARNFMEEFLTPPKDASSLRLLSPRAFIEHFARECQRENGEMANIFCADRLEAGRRLSFSWCVDGVREWLRV